MDGRKWKFYFFIVTLMAVKGMVCDNEIIKESGSRIGEYFNTSINTPFMFQEITTNQGNTESKATKYAEIYVFKTWGIHPCNITVINLSLECSPESRATDTVHVICLITQTFLMIPNLLSHYFCF